VGIDDSHLLGLTEPPAFLGNALHLQGMELEVVTTHNAPEAVLAGFEDLFERRCSLQVEEAADTSNEEIDVDDMIRFEASGSVSCITAMIS
jgi:hypothetical protein